MTHLLHTDVSAIPLADLPLEPESVVGGAPKASSAELADLGGLEIGVWEITAGTVTDVEVDEVMVVLSGRASVTFEADDSTIELRPGTAVRLRAGERTTWVVRETLRKVYISV